MTQTVKYATARTRRFHTHKVYTTPVRLRVWATSYTNNPYLTGYAFVRRAGVCHA